MKITIILMFVLFTNCLLLTAQPIDRGGALNVALFVPNGAELLDFAGPGRGFFQRWI